MEDKITKYKIVSMGGETLYGAMHPVGEEHLNINIRDAKGRLNIDYFSGYMDESMEMDELCKVYKKHKSEMSGKFVEMVNDYALTPALISVDFAKAYKAFNKTWCPAGDRYVRAGYTVSNSDMHDHACVRQIDGEDVLIAIELPHYVAKKKKYELFRYDKVQNPLPSTVLTKYFCYNADEQRYDRVETENGNTREFAQRAGVSKVREYLYVHGFYADGQHYVRYKRSAGKSREGSCLFIPEPLYGDMMQWSSAGLDPSTVSDLASWEAYIALTLSNKKATIVIPKASILVLRDQNSIFLGDVVAVSTVKDANDKNHIISEVATKTIANKIWDGEALLDVSVFDESPFKGHGMMLLRNRFFKTCAFNTNIQQWFKDNNITAVSQLNGFTTARKIEDIKLIVTDSSVKYLKMLGIDINDDDEFGKGVKQWLDNIDKYFGVVKTDDPSRFMDGLLVPTTYQLLNTLGLTKEEVEELLVETVEYMERIKISPSYLRHYLNYRLENMKDDDAFALDDDIIDEENILKYEEDESDVLDYRYTAVLDMLGISDEFTGTEFYKDEQRAVIKAIKNRVKHGKIYVHGQYATLFGNGAELLKAAITKNYIVCESELEGNAIHTSIFGYDKELLCSRNPHVTMGNVYIANNVASPFYDRYFNLTPQIVCVNAIKNNIQNRLNGCDYDSDTMLITDNDILLNVAKRSYDKFLVPVCCIGGSEQHYQNTLEDRAKLDRLIAENKIGEIVNTSQLFNSYLWNIHHNSPNEEKELAVYRDICVLAVLSGVEIDKAKRLYNVDMTDALDEIREHKKTLFPDALPKFFQFITKKNLEDGITMDTAMEYVYELIADENICKDKIDRCQDILEKKSYNVGTLDLVDGYLTKPGANDTRYAKNIIRLVSEAEHDLMVLNMKMKSQTDSEKVVSREKKEDILAGLLIDVAKQLKNDNIVRLLLKTIDSGEESRIANTLFAALCNEPTHRFYKMVTRRRVKPLYLLERTDKASDASEYIYGIPHKRQIIVL